jgi:hypothetical protein
VRQIDWKMAKAEASRRALWVHAQMTRSVDPSALLSAKTDALIARLSGAERWTDALSWRFATLDEGGVVDNAERSAGRL